MTAADIRVVALIPAHNEEANLANCVRSLRNQTLQPREIIIVADNCTDATVSVAEGLGCGVYETVGNSDVKAGALNQLLSHELPMLGDDDMILVMDADGALDPGFIENATKHILSDPKMGAVGGTFRGMDGGGLVGYLQRNEYARYGRDVRRLNGKCLVVTGTAAIFRVSTLRTISQARLEERIPTGDKQGGIYDTTVLTEDNELTFALLHLGYKVLSPPGCTLETEVMLTWKALWKQRLRWKRGAIENCMQYGFTKVTWRYWGRQLMTALGILVTFIYLFSLGAAFVANGSIHMNLFWSLITVVFVVERVVTVRDRGWKHMLLATTMFEVLYDLYMQSIHAKAYFDVLLSRKRSW